MARAEGSSLEQAFGLRPRRPIPAGQSNKTKNTQKQIQEKKIERLFYSTTLKDAPGIPQIGQRSEVWFSSTFPQTGQR